MGPWILIPSYLRLKSSKIVYKYTFYEKLEYPHGIESFLGFAHFWTKKFVYKYTFYEKLEYPHGIRFCPFLDQKVPLR